jgi:hypothetical protein
LVENNNKISNNFKHKRKFSCWWKWSRNS